MHESCLVDHVRAEHCADSVTLARDMRAAAILGLGCSSNNLRPFQTHQSLDWRMGMPAAADQADVVVLFGGDGTIHRHLSQLVKLGLPVLIVPAGSGNDFARALGLRRVRDSVAAWRLFCAGQSNVRAIDLGIINPLEVAGEYTSTLAQGRSGARESPRSAEFIPQFFCSVAGVGLDGEVARRANSLPRWLRGHGGYALSLAPTIFRFAPLPMKISTTDGTGWNIRSDQPTILAALANTSTYGGGMKIAPSAKVDDGQLDICVIGGIDRFKLACMFPTVYFGRHLSVSGVEYFQSARARVETEHPLAVFADGEYVCRTPVEVSVQHKALRVLTP